MRIAFIGMMALMLQQGGCDSETATVDNKQAIATNQLAAQADQQVGLPGVTQFTEKRLTRHLYELRDHKIATFAYIPDMQGRLWHLCDSIGYGLPYGVQFTNPERMNWTNNLGPNLPQPEPNGLFMPPSAEGTWIICAGAKGEEQPVYVEPRVIVSPFKLNAAGDYQVKP
jgi:hypothetical protein